MATFDCVQNPDLREILEEGQRRRYAAAAERRAEFLATATSIPDLEFLTPECPMCGLATEYDEGFTCAECDVWWPRNGYGHEARRG